MSKKTETLFAVIFVALPRKSTVSLFVMSSTRDRDGSSSCFARGLLFVMRLIVYFTHPFKNTKYQTTVHDGRYVSTTRLASLLGIDESQIKSACNFIEQVRGRGPL